MNNDAPELALEAYQASLKSAGEEDNQALLRAAELLTRSGNYALAQTMIADTRKHFGNKLSEDDDFTLLTLEAKIARAQGDDSKAVAALNRIVEHDALNGEAIIELPYYDAPYSSSPTTTSRTTHNASSEQPATRANHHQILVLDQ
jgi:outer membrane PBP1 activator LpoA protein